MKKIIIIFMCLLFTGCYNYRELNEIAITSAIGISKENDNYKVIMQIINTNKTDNSSLEEPKFYLFKTEEKTLQEAFRKVILESPKRLFVNHIQLLIIDENLAKEGIKDVLDIFARDTEFRKQFLVVISKDSTDEDILSTQTSLENINAKSIFDSINADLNYLGVTQELTLEKLLDTYTNDKLDIMIPTVKMIGSKSIGENNDNLKNTNNQTRIILDSLSIFKDDKLLTNLSLTDSININYIQDNIKNSIISYKCNDNNYTAIEIINSKTDSKCEENKFTFDIKMKANINEIHCNIDLKKEEDLKKFEKDIEEYTKNSILETLDKIKKNNSDIIGFKDIIYKNNPKYYKTLDKNTILSNLEFDVKVNLDLIAKGNLLQVINNEK